MRGAESVVDVEVGQIGQLLGKFLIVLFFFGVEAEVLEQQGLAVFQFAGHLFGFQADAIGTEADVFSASKFFIEQHAEALGDGLQAYMGFGLPLGRPRWEARMRRAPWRRAYSIVGRVSRMRVSSMTRPSSRGTLKSTRMKMRWSLRGRSRMESLDISGVPAQIGKVASRLYAIPPARDCARWLRLDPSFGKERLSQDDNAKESS